MWFSFNSRPVRSARLLFITALALLTLPVVPTAAGAAGSAYVVNGSASVSQYAIGAGGALSSLNPPTVATELGPTDIAITPNGKSAYVPVQGTTPCCAPGTVLEYNVDPVTGALSPKAPAGVPTGRSPAVLAVSPNGKSAYVSDGDGKVSQYDIDPSSGALSPKSPATVPVAALGFAFSPDGTRAYVTDGYSVFLYDIEPVSGSLAPSPRQTVASSLRPDSITVTPDGRSAYVVDGLGAVSQFDIDPSSGTLSPKSPAVVDASLDPGGIAVTPDGKSAYVACEHFFGVAGYVCEYDIDPVSGTLSPKSAKPVATGLLPSSVAVNSDGKSAYVINRSDNDISQYDVDPQTGALSPKTPATVGTQNAPGNIALGPLPRVPTSKDQCKDDRWRNFPQFKNQGQCVAFVEHAG